MAKNSGKKKNLRLRRRVRKTLGAACLITSLLVAAIPVPEASAAVAEEKKLTWETEIGKDKSTIPMIEPTCQTIYTTEDGMFQFAWVKESKSSTQMIAVILGYNGGTLTGGNLVIPDTVDAYTKFSENEGTGTGYVAVGQNQKPLYYRSKVVYKQDASGNDLEEIDEENCEYLPCYANTRDQWFYTDVGVERPLTEFYYEEGGKYKPTQNTNEQWIRHITVAYIGNQYLEPTGASGTGAQQEWKIASAVGSSVNTEPDKGIFANQGNITNLTVGPNLIGIGNYAFYNCSTLRTIKLGNGIQEIGHHAFAECQNMMSIDMEFNSRLNYISDYTFYNCRSLSSFTLPAQVTQIYDHAFDGCESLSSVYLNGEGQSGGGKTALNAMGHYVFNGCKALTDLVLPSSLTGLEENSQPNAVHLNNFAGCTNLKHIQVLNSSLHLAADTNPGAEEYAFTVDNFKAQVDPTFYFEAEDVSGTHEYTKENVLAFKYAGEDRYEIIMLETAVEGGTDGKAKLTYQVNSENKLLYFNMDAPVSEVTIPSAIGPYGVSSIDHGSFGGGGGSCYLKKITIPATVTAINDDAFRGCHNLEHVIFQDASRITYIGNNAFATQLMEGEHQSGCKSKDFLDNTKPGFVSEPKLTFTGAVGDNIVPFNYAMNPSSNINQGAQQKTYITYYSGWPTNLEIRYVENADGSGGAATLIDYPTYDELKAGTKYGEKKSDSYVYPYMTDAYAKAAKEAIDHYESAAHITDLTDYERQIVDAALNVSVPAGVKRITPGLFSGKTASQREDGTYQVSAVDGQKADEHIQTVTFADIAEFEPYSFTGCKNLNTVNITGGEAALDDYAFAWEYSSVSDGDPISNHESPLKSVVMSGGGSTVGDYAFANNYNLTNVQMSPTVSELGRRPFKDCSQLNDVNFSGGPYFTTERAIVYGLEDGAKSSIVECLESRGTIYGGQNGGASSSVSAEETAGVTSIAPEAFMDCEGIGLVDLRNSQVATVPERAFANTSQLNSVYLPSQYAHAIEKEAFHNSNVRYVEVPKSVAIIQPSAFNTPEHPRTDGGQLQIVEFYCEEGTPAEYFANEYDNIIITHKPDSTEFTVQFWYQDPGNHEAAPVLLTEEKVPIGGDATAPDAPEFEGYRFVSWMPDYHAVSADLTVTAQYEKIDSEELKYTVRYINWDDSVWYEARVAKGEDAPNIVPPSREGYVFTGWRPALTNITADVDVYAQFERAVNSSVSGGNGNGNGNGNGSGNGNGTAPQMYTLTVRNGSGSGSYVAGATVIVVANEPASTQEFDKWTQEGTADLKMASTTISATTLVMPAANTTVTANYVNKSGTNNNNSNNNNNNNGSGGSGTTSKPIVSGNGGSTTVIIDKNGLSNTGVVSVTVNGSSDNFVLKISEDTAATEAALRALTTEFGSLDNIKYFPMDISLYDSTGTKKITDTTGLKITITLPLPDSLITYAGNNRIAGVVDDKLDKLSPKFTTIDGVSCITFTAEHFSPYVMYVNTSNLESVGVADNSPKTGDIHPKWFVAIALACMSVILFVKRDKAGKKAAVRA